MKIEICCNSIDSAINAQHAGADRVEICTELAVGGITPSHGYIEKALEDISIPMNVLIRPRGGDFTYSTNEFEVMLRDIAFCREIGCNGVVTGTLLEDNRLDVRRMELLARAAGNMEFTFHRAFDWVKTPLTVLDQLADLGIDTVLTSGQHNNIEEGIANLALFKEHSAGKLTIMPGGGIQEKNILQFRAKNFEYIHFTGVEFENRMQQFPNVLMHSEKFFDERKVAVSNVERMKRLIAAAKV